MTSALLFVAILVAVELSYRRWVRRSLAKRRKPAVEMHAVDLAAVEKAEAETEGDAAVIPLPERKTPHGDARRSG